MLLIRKEPLETWRDAVARVGEHLGIAWELLGHYDQLRTAGLSETKAVEMVAKEWSVVGNVAYGEVNR